MPALQGKERLCSAGDLMACERLWWVGAQAGLPVLLEGDCKKASRRPDEFGDLRRPFGSLLRAGGRWEESELEGLFFIFGEREGLGLW